MKQQEIKKNMETLLDIVSESINSNKFNVEVGMRGEKHRIKFGDTGNTIEAGIPYIKFTSKKEDLPYNVGDDGEKILPVAIVVFDNDILIELNWGDRYKTILSNTNEFLKWIGKF